MAEGQRPVGEEHPIDQPLRYLPPVDARLLPSLTGIPSSTLNVWIGRGIFPWVRSGIPGRVRFFTADFAMHLVIVGFLVRLGVGVAQASNAALDIMADSDFGRPHLKAIIGPTGGPTGMFTSPEPRQVRLVQAEVLSGDDLDGGCIVLDISRMMQRLVDAVSAL